MTFAEPINDHRNEDGQSERAPVASESRLVARGDLGAPYTPLEDARRMLRLQADAISQLSERIGVDYQRALDLILSCRGRLVCSGIGKSGIIARKLAATFASTGTPSSYLHPADALHGDLGMVQPDDLALLVSYSGETLETNSLVVHLRRLGVGLITIVGDVNSTLGTAADVALDASVEREACPHNLAPTTSTLASLALGDALAMSLMRARDFSKHDFARVHPGGALGTSLKTVGDVMQRDRLPLVRAGSTVESSLISIATGGCGTAVVVDEQQHLKGIVTDGDLRRALSGRPNLLAVEIDQVMTPDPITVTLDTLASEADALMRRLRLNALLVVDESGRVCGLVHIFK